MASAVQGSANAWSGLSRVVRHNVATAVNMARRRWRFVSPVVAGLVLALGALGCGQLLGPKATLGPGAIVRGRGHRARFACDRRRAWRVHLRAKWILSSVSVRNRRRQYAGRYSIDRGSSARQLLG